MKVGLIDFLDGGPMGKIISRKSIYSLEKPVWLDKSGMSKGIRHGRQHLGIILHENTDLEIRAC